MEVATNTACYGWLCGHLLASKQNSLTAYDKHLPLISVDIQFGFQSGRQLLFRKPALQPLSGTTLVHPNAAACRLRAKHGKAVCHGHPASSGSAHGGGKDPLRICIVGGGVGGLVVGGILAHKLGYVPLPVATVRYTSLGPAMLFLDWAWHC
jgi:hypothetical protein